MNSPVARRVYRTMRHPLPVLLLLLCIGIVPVMAAPDKTGETTQQALADEAMKVREQLGEAFTVVVQPPFVVAGDESPEVVQRRAQRTVGWAVERLKRRFFEHDPDHIITIYLFKDRESYLKHTEGLWDETPSTPYGYYSPGERVMAMNIATGGGTLVHEIVHPFVAANFPKAPAWLNEGLGSLYEQSAQRDGEIIGLTNWRLAGLQRAIRDDKLGPLTDLLATSTKDFYGDDAGRNYAQARYLLMYLQEHSLLNKFYHAFHDAREADPTGVATLKHVLDEDDLDAFERRWRKWVMGLRFER